MQKSTTNADCPFCMIQRYLLYLEFYMRAALVKKVKVIIKLICIHSCTSFYLLNFCTLCSRFFNLSIGFFKSGRMRSILLEVLPPGKTFSAVLFLSHRRLPVSLLQKRIHGCNLPRWNASMRMLLLQTQWHPEKIFR